MSEQKHPAISLLIPWLFTCVAGLPMTASANAIAVSPAEYIDNRITCETPVRLVHDCSIWHGATRPIAFGSYRMRLAAGNEGRTIMLSRLRPGPDHNGGTFEPSISIVSAGTCAIRLIGSALEAQGIRLERMQTIRHGGRVDAWFLQFSGNAYDYLKQFTALESEYWLPTAQNRR